jgi:hypothetical protein
MTKDELREKMLAFIESKDGDYNDEWYATPRDFAAVTLSDFAEYLGIEIVIPDYIPRLTKPEVNRNELLKSLMPEVAKLFNIEFDKHKEKMNDQR